MLPSRAVAVALDGRRLLVMRRHKAGKDYCVLPGGGVEPGERPDEACLRELVEETGRAGTMDRHLWTIEHVERVAHYFLVRVEPGPLTLDGPESVSQSGGNRYTREWIALDDLRAANLQPEAIREPLLGLLA